MISTSVNECQWKAPMQNRCGRAKTDIFVSGYEPGGCESIQRLSSLLATAFEAVNQQLAVASGKWQVLIVATRMSLCV